MAKTKKEKPQSQQGSSVSMCEICQQVKYLSEETIKRVLEEKKDIILNYCYIKHNKDKKEDGTPKEDHWHLFLKFKANYYTGAVAQWFGITENYVERIRSQRYNTGALYCVHAHDLSKYQYNPAEVVANFDYIELVRKDAEKRATNARKKEIIEQIQSGIIREYNMHEKISAFEFVYFKTLIENAFEYRRRAISDEQRDKQVVFIQGDAGTGKTTYAKKLAKDKGLSFYIAGASNDPLESYKGQDVLILDDLRGSAQRLDDLLKLLDNNTTSLAKARYHNKVLECQIVIITTSQDINTFFKNAFADDIENITQLKRRCKTYMQMSRDDIIVSMYNEKLRDYMPVAHLENPIKNLHPVEELTQEKIDAQLTFLFGENRKDIKAESITVGADDDIISFEPVEEKDLFEFFS